MLISNPFIKICGITRQKDLTSAVECGASAIGFIAYKKSPRYVSPLQVAELIEVCPPDILKVVVVVNVELAEIDEYLKAGIDVVQLHGSEDEVFARKVKAQVWKALRLHQVEQIKEYADFPCSMFVVDSFVKDSVIPGGTGHLGDWQLAAEFTEKASAPVLLAGGIKAVNAKSAIEQVGCAGLDLSSGVEDEPGIKNHQKIEAFFKALQ